MNELLNEDQRERRGRHVVDLICSSRGMASIRLVAALLVASPLAAASAVASSGAPPARDQSRPRDASPPTLNPSARSTAPSRPAMKSVLSIALLLHTTNALLVPTTKFAAARCHKPRVPRVSSPSLQPTAARAGSCVAGGGFDGECAVTYSGYDAALA